MDRWSELVRGSLKYREIFQDHSQTYVQNKITEYLNRMVQIGIAGYRVGQGSNKYMSKNAKNMAHIIWSVLSIKCVYF